MDNYCYDCATNRCDCYPDECPIERSLAPTEKLVRDGYAHLPHRIAQSGERYGLLAMKFEEEISEVKAADFGSTEFAEELGDLIEVCYALGGEKRVESLRLAKRAARGAFELGVVLRLEEGEER